MLARIALAALCTALPLAGVGQEARPAAADVTELNRSAEAVQAEPMEGPWPSPKLMDLMLARWADGASAQFELDAGQSAEVREFTRQRWSTFLNENRARIQPLVNEYFEMHLEAKPPTKDQVRAWSERALPVFEQLRAELDQGVDDFRKVLKPAQKAEFELRALEFEVGMELAEQKLKHWQKGEFNEREFWTPPRHQRRARREEPRREATGKHKDAIDARGAASPRAESAEDDQIELELQAWDKFVAEFIRAYRLNEGQRTAALSCLNELKERARGHRDRRREEIAALEHRIHNSGSEQEMPKIKQQLIELYGPIDEMFRELKARLEQIPTTAQRASVAPPKGND